MVSVAVGAAVFIAIICVLIRVFSADVYDVIIVKMTERWYAAVLARLDDGARVLDVGIGTGSALCRHAKALKGRDMKFVGVDYDKAYVDKARSVARSTGVSDRLTLHCKSVYDNDLAAVVGSGFDAAYFSGSFSLMPDPVGALRAVAPLLKPGGVIYITQTYQKVHTPLFGTLKPLLKYITTIDFGALTYEADIARILKESGMKVEHNAPIPGSVDNHFQVAKLIILKP
eukprot:TRINITY_DN70004_c0_g1_i1.p1 TRINITY_DN70004_c0_g1~~TRINITY_DN70004_c0_g1_i1.p1  ORF type:complete len:255 (+),score=100.77 TRINITY_DN70004_c0_g1_i1:80-766(+)